MDLLLDRPKLDRLDPPLFKEVEKMSRPGSYFCAATQHSSFETCSQSWRAYENKY